MTRIYLILLSLILWSTVSVKAQEDSFVTKAKTFVQDLQDENYEAARLQMDKNYRVKMHPVALKNAWDDVLKEGGMLKNLGQAKVTKTNTNTVVEFPAEFSKTGMALRITYNARQQVSDLQFKPISIIHAIESNNKDSASEDTKIETNLPSYANSGSYIQKEVSLNMNNHSLPGTLTLPKTGSKWPMVILIQSYGPLDRDETMGPNKPFRDIALGLAAQGVASFRYDKRDYVYKAEFENGGSPITANTETVEDAIAAINFVRGLGYVDKKKVYIFGHGVGGYLAPRIAQHAPFLGGVIMFGANGIPLEEALVKKDMFILEKKNDPDTTEKFAELQSKLHLVRSDSLNMGVIPDQLPGGMPASYWQDLKNYSAPYTAYDLSVPMFIMRGSRDIEMTNVDFDRWRVVLRRKTNVKYKTYPVNHVMMEGKNEISLPEEYNSPGHVPLYLITDMAEWMKKEK